MELGQVNKYIKGKTEVTVNFPEQAITCRYCPFCKCEQMYGRYSCRLTEEWLLGYDKGIGGECPLEFKEDEQ